jgi:hypothetical protein
MKFGLKNMFLSCLSLAMSIPASADTIKATITNVTPSQTLGIVYNGHSENAWAGILQWKLNEGSTLGLNSNFQTFCVEIAQNVYVNSKYTFNVVSASDTPYPTFSTGMGAARADRLEELFGRYYDIADDSNNNAAAFQVAVWEIVNDDTLSLNAGAFKLSTPSSTIGNLAQGWLNSINGTGQTAKIGGLTSASYQDQVYFISMDPTPGPIPSVPVPAAAWTGGALLLGLAVAKARKMAQA